MNCFIVQKDEISFCIHIMAIIARESINKLKRMVYNIADFPDRVSGLAISEGEKTEQCQTIWNAGTAAGL